MKPEIHISNPTKVHRIQEIIMGSMLLLWDKKTIVKAQLVRA